jgi:glycosyl hydrolase family 38
VIVRIYNPLSHAVEASLQPGFACTRAFVAKLDEEPETGHPQGVPLHIGLRAGEIVTVLFQ